MSGMDHTTERRPQHDLTAISVRSEGDHGPSAEVEMAARRADDFEAGTRVVWDVDPFPNRSISLL
jgi:hypothetical protein